MMIDEDVVAISASTVYRVLSMVGLLGKRHVKPSLKGRGFLQPLKAHEHCHIDVSYLNLSGTFYYLCSALDGFSRYIAHWEIRESKKERDVEIIPQRGKEKFSDASPSPRVISDNGPQFVVKDFKEFIRLSGMPHVCTSPFYPQSNGKQERMQRLVKQECIKPKCPQSVSEARKIVAEYVQYYKDKRLHSSIGYWLCKSCRYASRPTERDTQGKGTKTQGGKSAVKSKMTSGKAEVFLVFREKRSQIKFLWKRRKIYSYLNGISGV
jgi:putative transposase